MACSADVPEGASCSGVDSRQPDALHCTSLQQQQPQQLQEPQQQQARALWRKGPARVLGVAGKAVKGLVRPVVTPVRRQRQRQRRRRGAFASLSASALSDPYGDDDDVDEAPSAAASPALASPGTSCRASHHGATTFPTELQHMAEGIAGRGQKLLAIGARHWGSSSWWDTRSMLKLKIYDFAVYADPAAARSVALSPAALMAESAGVGGGGDKAGALGRRILSQLVTPASGSPPMDATLLLQAARDLPVEQLGQELFDVLDRRSVKVGGTANDPALQRLIGFLSRTSIPPSTLTPDQSHVRRGSSIVFSRRSNLAPLSGPDAESSPDPAGDADDVRPLLALPLAPFAEQLLAPAQLQPQNEAVTEAAARPAAGASGDDVCEIVAHAGSTRLGSVHSCTLSTALFDLYMGEEPVCPKARDRAERSLARLAADERSPYVPSKDERLVCGRGGSADTPACVVELL